MKKKNTRDESEFLEALLVRQADGKLKNVKHQNIQYWRFCSFLTSLPKSWEDDFEACQISVQTIERIFCHNIKANFKQGNLTGKKAGSKKSNNMYCIHLNLLN